MRRYSPQPYQQSAKVLRESGRPEKAADVLYAGKESEREQARKRGNWGRYMWLTVLKYTIGYGLGLRYFYSLCWLGPLLFFGTVVCRSGNKSVSQPIFDEEVKGQNNKENKKVLPFAFYSLDMLLPLIKLRSRHETVDLPTPQRYYFYFHQICGWLLASFILAGLAGITQH